MKNSGLQTLVSRGFGALGQACRTIVYRHEDSMDIDPYGPSPMGRDDLRALFETEPTSPWSADSDMRESERLEYHTMTLIRDALYPPSDEVSVSST